MRSLLAGATLTLALVSSAVAGDPPWAERTLTDPLDLGTVAREGDAAIDALITRGGELFGAKFTTLDGAGRPMATQAIVPTKRKRPGANTFQRTSGLDANACSGCHNEPITGGAGEFVGNVFVSEGFESAEFDSLDPQFSSERNTNALMGAGLIEMLAREMTAELHTIRQETLRKARASGEPVTEHLIAKGVDFGSITAAPDGMLDITKIEGIDSDLVLRPFSQKGVFVSLRQFTVNALNQHHGIEAVERFGKRWTGADDFDEDGYKDEVSDGDISAMVAWQATLPTPTRRQDIPESWKAAAAQGEELFGKTGCAACHRPSLPLDGLVFTDPGPSDMAGTLNASEVDTPISIDFARFDWVAKLPRDEMGRVLVPLFGDLRRHKIADQRNDRLGNELLAQRFVARDDFMTAELWGIGSTAPYGHRGDMTTLDEVIRAHGAEGADAAKAFEALAEDDRSAIIAFLKTLVIEDSEKVGQ
ncbi:putative thiol oxidoreductase [Hartmannibacter diazotrophicus]|uniref:Putative thiol oxidoreductase n=1 Tax=Hartmannibacter diazotrophicus TaxID=1482074 RepID=A0A2C9D2F5_9HYPH|nr:di-heme oxidoredictase family protein [Hartmannibacter diazotrophicus]SON54446.1 putative thiol oxidoreductase [Hartmannibacter diazotrophicus]